MFSHLSTYIMAMKTGILRCCCLCILAGLYTDGMHAQKNIFDNYEISLHASGGLSALRYTSETGGETSYGAGYSFGWDAAFFFTEQWAFRTGIDMTSYNARVTFDRQENRYLVTTPAGLPADSRFYLVAEYRQYEEKQEALYLRFPLMVQYRTPGVKARFYAAAGLQVGIRANATYRIRSGTLTTRGYSDYTAQYYEEFSGHGFETYPDISAMGKLNLGVALSGALETGMMWTMKNGMALYTCVYVDYAFNDIRKDSPSEEAIVYNESLPSDYRYNSILHSQTDGKPLTGKVQPFAVGLRLRWSMQFGKGTSPAS